MINKEFKENFLRTLDIKIGEEFFLKLYGSIYNRSTIYRFTDELAIEEKSVDSYDEWKRADYSIVWNLIRGSDKIIKKMPPFRNGDTYYHIDIYFNERYKKIECKGITKETWTGSPADFDSLVSNNCFRTEEEALDKVLSYLDRCGILHVNV